MRELFVFIPEYSITSKILKSISVIEYSKAIIENTTILPSWERQLVKEAKVKTVMSLLKMEGVNTNQDQIKRHFDGIINNAYISNITSALSLVEQRTAFDDSTLKEISKALIPNSKGYRGIKAADKTDPEEILAEIVQFFDWVNGKDSLETHPLLVSAIILANIERIQPFENFNLSTSFIASQIFLTTTGYEFKGYIGFADYFHSAKHVFVQLINSINKNNLDFTGFIEYFVEAIASESATVKEKVKLLARDTKVAKATGYTDLNERQERIVEYLQDYGTLQNKDFGRLFPHISEDTVLRQLKALIDKNIVVKRGSTKSSRYELK